MRVLRLLGGLAIVVLTTAVVIAIAVAIHEVKPPGYTAQAVLVVPANAAAADSAAQGVAPSLSVSPFAKKRNNAYQGPGLAEQANALALTFAGLIPNDQAILRAASRRLGRSTNDIQGRLTVSNDASTSILRVAYDGASRAEALLGATTIARAVSGSHPATGAIPPGALMLIRLPTSTTSAYTTATLLGVGAALGIALGLLLVVVRNRANPRLGAPRDIERLLDVPVTAARWLNGDRAALLLQDWYAIAARSGRVPGDSVATVALVPTTKGATTATRDLAAWLMSPHNASSDDASPDNASPDDAAAVEETEQSRVASGVPSPRARRSRRRSGGHGQSVSLSAYEPRGLVDVAAFEPGRRGRDLDLGAIARHDVLVLVVAPGTTTRRVARTIDLLAETGRQPDAAIFANLR